MPAHAKAYERLHRALACTDDRARQDELLDEILSCQQEATEWDADQWGLSPDWWMETERAELAARGGPEWPSEPQMRWRQRPTNGPRRHCA